nr:translation initiation factor IF-2-like [Gorilla gorilla gorilla]
MRRLAKRQRGAEKPSADRPRPRAARPAPPLLCMRKRSGPGKPPPRRRAAGSRAPRGPIPPGLQPSLRGAQRLVPPASPASPGTARLARGALRAATLPGSPARLSSPSLCLASNFASRYPLRRRPLSRRSPEWSPTPRGRRGYGKFGDWREKGLGGGPRRGARGASSLPFMGCLTCVSLLP